MTLPLWVLCACSGTQDKSDMAAIQVDQAPPIDQAASLDQGAALTGDQACADYATAWCTKDKSCTRGTGIQRTYGDMATCQARQKMDCLDRLGAPDSTYTPLAFARCAAALPDQQSCAQFFVSQFPAACGSGKKGRRAQGQVCVTGAQCNLGTCQFLTGSGCGTCQAAPQVGSPCDNTSCLGTQYCSAAAGKTCQTLVQQGGPCDYADRGSACYPELACQAVLAAQPGTCQQAPGSTNAACDPSLATLPPCDRRYGLVCDTSNKKCVTVSYADKGQPCDGLYTQCKASGICSIPTGANMGTCQAHLADGAPCDTGKQPSCLSPARCVVNGNGTAGTCQFADAAHCM